MRNQLGIVGINVAFFLMLGASPNAVLGDGGVELLTSRPVAVTGQIGAENLDIGSLRGTLPGSTDQSSGERIHIGHDDFLWERLHLDQLEKMPDWISVSFGYHDEAEVFTDSAVIYRHSFVGEVPSVKLFDASKGHIYNIFTGGALTLLGNGTVFSGGTLRLNGKPTTRPAATMRVAP